MGAVIDAIADAEFFDTLQIAIVARGRIRYGRKAEGGVNFNAAPCTGMVDLYYNLASGPQPRGQQGEMMFSHVMLGSNDIERSKRFYDAVLGTLGASQPVRNKATSGHTRLFYQHDGSSFCISEPINGEGLATMSSNNDKE
jgi:hypothetical protein